MGRKGFGDRSVDRRHIPQAKSRKRNIKDRRVHQCPDISLTYTRPGKGPSGPGYAQGEEFPPAARLGYVGYMKPYAASYEDLTATQLFQEEVLQCGSRVGRRPPAGAQVDRRLRNASEPLRWLNP